MVAHEYRTQLPVVRPGVTRFQNESLGWDDAQLEGQISEIIQILDQSSAWMSVKVQVTDRNPKLHTKTLLAKWEEFLHRVQGGNLALPPNAISMELAARVLRCLRSLGVTPQKIVASVEGGVGFIFTWQDKYADIECFNSGTMAAVVYDNSTDPKAWDIANDETSIKGAINTIVLFLNG